MRENNKYYKAYLEQVGAVMESDGYIGWLGVSYLNLNVAPSFLYKKKRVSPSLLVSAMVDIWQETEQGVKSSLDERKTKGGERENH